MKKDDVIIITCSVCGALSHAIKAHLQEGYYVKDEFIICKICFGLLKWLIQLMKLKLNLLAVQFVRDLHQKITLHNTLTYGSAIGVEIEKLNGGP